jgi:hypothetical protein
MDQEVNRAIARNSDGWIDWSDILNCPRWIDGKIQLDGRFTADELRAILQFERKAG